jgi:hypothetical protein
VFDPARLVIAFARGGNGWWRRQAFLC